MTLDDLYNLATQFVEELEFDTLLIWADILGVDCDENQWSDDDWVDRMEELQVAVAEAMVNLGRAR